MNDVHISQLDLNLFVVFEAIFATGSVTGAGERLYLRQPAASHALARMRETFGDPLFVRHGRAPAPTPLARKMIEPVRRAPREFEASVARVETFDPARMRKRLVVGMRDVHEATVLPELLRAISRSAPMSDLSTVRVKRRDLEAELATGSLDMAIDVSLPLSDEIRRTRFMAGKLVVVARRGHTRLLRVLDLKTYLAQQHIMVTTRRRARAPRSSSLPAAACGDGCGCAARATLPRAG